MSSLLKRQIVNFLICFFALLTSACGVKGNPLPPERPVDLGRGRPTYKRATEGLKVERARPTPEDSEDEEKEESADDEQD